MMRRYYEILDISENATETEIKKAYKRMASKYHPDKNPDDPTAADKFKEVKEAYECLSDPERRVAYDERGDTGQDTSNPVEDLVIHMTSEILEHFDSSWMLLFRMGEVLDDMVEEIRGKDVKARERQAELDRMIKALRYNGKGVNLIGNLMEEKLKDEIQDQKDLATALQAAITVKEMLKEYSATDKPQHDPGMSEQEYEEAREELAGLFRKVGHRFPKFD